jgi:hypothetical protein
MFSFLRFQFPFDSLQFIFGCSSCSYSYAIQFGLMSAESVDRQAYLLLGLFFHMRHLFTDCFDSLFMLFLLLSKSFLLVHQ